MGTQYLSVKLRSGKTMLVKRKGASRSRYFHSHVLKRAMFQELNKMWTHKKDGYGVTLLSQNADSTVTYTEDGKEPLTVPSHQFFTDFAQGEPTKAEKKTATK